MQIDKEIWQRIGDSDEEAFATAYRFYFKRFYNYGRKFTTDEDLISDCAQETLLTIWDKRRTLAEIEHTATYFYAAYRYTLFQRLRRQQKVVTADQQPDEPEFSAEEIIILKETNEEVKAQLYKALSTLTPRQKEAIFLRFYENLSYEEVASVLNITVKATYKIMARALLQLKSNLPFLKVLVLTVASFIK